ncbi:Transposable element tc3 transposase protein [Rutstroemia sp. NJR-2017a BVV2]|nr:Transposable element tc3 transposase protein [Rutstroemia sp. NJR-2017a BVV2]
MGSTKPAAIATTLKVHDSAIRYTLQYMELHSNGEDLPRAARKLSYSDRDECVIICYIQLFPKHTYKQIKSIYRVKCSTTTIKQLLKKYGITNWRCKKRPELSEVYTLKRLVWCLVWRGLTTEEWDLVIWSDKCSVERGQGEKWDKNIVQTYRTDKNMKVMVWAAFWDTRRSNLYIIDRDFEAAKQRLESCLQAAWDTLDNTLFKNLIESIPRRIEAYITAKE